jgi:hypothetical protein
MAEDKYKFKGKEYTYADLESKYGDRTSEAIESFGFEKMESAPQEDLYEFKGKEYTYADLESKYGDRTGEAIESFGIKKKSQTQPSSETATTTAEESVSEAPSTSTEEVTQPVVQEPVVQETEPTQPTKPLDPYYQEKGQEAVESFTPQYGLDHWTS